MFIVAGIFAQNEPNVCVVCASLYVCVCACTFYWITQVWVWKIEQIFLATFEPLKWQPASARNLISMDVYDLLNEYRIQQVHWIELDRIDSNELEFQNRRKEEKKPATNRTPWLYLWFTITLRMCVHASSVHQFGHANVSVCTLYQESSMHVQKHIPTTKQYTHSQLSLSPMNCNSGWIGKDRKVISLLYINIHTRISNGSLVQNEMNNYKTVFCWFNSSAEI